MMRCRVMRRASAPHSARPSHAGVQLASFSRRRAAHTLSRVWRALALRYMKADNDASAAYSSFQAAHLDSTSNGKCEYRRRLGGVRGYSDGLRILYVAQDIPGNVLTSRSLREAKLLEDKLRNDPKYDDHCYPEDSDSDGRTCDASQVEAVTDYFFSADGELLEISGVTEWMARTIESSAFFDVYFSTDNQKSNVTYSGFKFFVEDRKQYEEWLINDVLPELEAASTTATRVMWVNTPMNNHETQVALLHDSQLSIGSLLFVALCMVVHTRSVLLTVVAMLQILISIPAAMWF